MTRLSIASILWVPPRTTTCALACAVALSALGCAVEPGSFAAGDPALTPTDSPPALSVEEDLSPDEEAAFAQSEPLGEDWAPYDGAQSVELNRQLRRAVGRANRQLHTRSFDPTKVQLGSRIGAVVFNALDQTAHNRRLTTWNVTSDNSFGPADVLGSPWLLSTPNLFGRSYADLAQAVTCNNPGDPRCNSAFGLKRCTVDDDCSATGRCEAVQATVSKPGQQAERLCVGHSDRHVDEIYRIVRAGQRLVDVTSLTAPDGRYVAALRNAITYLSHSTHAPVVRLLFGTYPVQGEMSAKNLLRDLTSEVRRGSDIEVYVGCYRAKNIPPSWNHSKIVAADGAVALTGGHNMWAAHYLGIKPVSDLSMKVAGTAAADAQRFANPQWDYTCNNASFFYSWTGSVQLASLKRGKVGKVCPPRFDETTHGSAAPMNASEGASVFSLGRLAWVDGQDQSNDADTGIYAAMAAATSSIKIVQQDIGPVQMPYLDVPLGKWPSALFEQLGLAMLRGVDVTLLLSTPGATVGGLPPTEATYSNGYTALQVAQQLRKYMASRAYVFPQGAALDELLCSKLTVANWRYSAEQSYPDANPIPNHAKAFIIDDQAFYIGSQNLYESALTEHGYLVDDASASAAFLRSYWQPSWEASRRTAVTGQLAQGTCALLD